MTNAPVIKTEIYLQPKRYNRNLRATISGAWICDSDNGCFAICPDYAAKTSEQALAILNGRGQEQYVLINA